MCLLEEKKINICSILNLIKKTPFYPHWLETKNRKKGDDKVCRYLFGKVIEVGAPDLTYKQEILKNNRNVKWYITSDFSSWDYYRFNYKMMKHSFFGRIMHILKGGNNKKPEMVCDAKILPFFDSSFDSYCSFEVLEHVRDPKQMLLEANRVLKENGICVLSVPFLYRVHPTDNLDFQRLTKNGLCNLAEDCGFKLITNITYSFIGTTEAAQINQFIIRAIFEAKLPIKVIVFIISPIAFFISNTFGYLLDLIQNDMRFATRYHVVLQKLD